MITDGFRIFTSPDLGKRIDQIAGGMVYPLVMPEELKELPDGYYDEDLLPVEDELA